MLPFVTVVVITDWFGLSALYYLLPLLHILWLKHFSMDFKAT